MASQEIHVRAREETFRVNPNMSSDDKATVLIDSITDMYLASAASAAACSPSVSGRGVPYATEPPTRVSD
jgi:hypothetical protein